jgi:tetratricopeptide (TPR) repeat protein
VQWNFKLSPEARRRKDKIDRLVFLCLVPLVLASAAHAYGRYQRHKEALQRFAQGDREWDRGKIDAAEREFSAVLSLDPGFFPARDALSILAWQRGDMKRAVELLREGVRLDPRNAQAHYSLGETLFLMHDFKAAIPPLEVAERLRPTPKGSPSLLATCRTALVYPPRFRRDAGHWTRRGRHATIKHPCSHCSHDHDHPRSK